jgi:uncharacterized damage-inducible protein DinB
MSRHYYFEIREMTPALPIPIPDSPVPTMVNYGTTELAKAYRTVRRNTIQAANDIPEDKYDFRPAPDTRTVRELLGHVAFITMIQYDFHRDRRLTTLAGYDFPAFMARMNGEANKHRSKSELIALLEAEGEKFAQWVESLSDDFLNETYTDPMGANPRTRFEHLLSAKEHEMHHRGQLMLIQRMVGVVPHLTREAQERRARAAAAQKS